MLRILYNLGTYYLCVYIVLDVKKNQIVLQDLSNVNYDDHTRQGINRQPTRVVSDKA